MRSLNVTTISELGARRFVEEGTGVLCDAFQVYAELFTKCVLLCRI